jgi:hypothetical protein
MPLSDLALRQAGQGHPAFGCANRMADSAPPMDTATRAALDGAVPRRTAKDAGHVELSLRRFGAGLAIPIPAR